MICRIVFVILNLICLVATHADERIQFFEKRIRPILVDHCYSCHGAEDAVAGLRLDLKHGWERGGGRGPAIVPGDPAASLLVRAVRYSDSTIQMPPEDAGGRLSDQQIQDIVTWIRQGAEDPRTGEILVSNIDLAARDHWAFQPVSPPLVPDEVHPIDWIIERTLAAQQFAPAEPADIRTLIRRAVYSLHGLPPTSEQLAGSAEQFPQFMTQLLDSPRYGERWGRHWLDVARYSDARDGVLMYGDARIRAFAYTYRDYVIRAFNEDKPFDQFVREQLAADRMSLPQDSPELAAMGLLTLGRMFDGNRHDVIDDQIDVVTRGFLGLTATCARCHDHKFDPIPTADYYSLYGVFASSTEPYDRPRIAAVAPEGEAFETEFSEKLREVRESQETHYQATLQTARERTPDYLVQVATTEPDVAETTIFFLSLTPDQLRPQITRRWRQMIARRAFPDDSIFGPWHDLMQSPELQPELWRDRGIDRRVIDGLMTARPSTPVEIAHTYGQIIYDIWQLQLPGDPVGELLEAPSGPVWFPREEVASYLSRQPGDAFRGLLSQLDSIAVKHRAAAARAMIVVDAQVLCEPVIFQRGDPALRGTPVRRQFLGILSPQGPVPFSDGGGRLNLANAIASRENPLTARVWVNRVWMHHFGEPLVDPPGDFGLQTQQPVHAELLDYLAAYFIRNGWRTKPLHQLILSSRAWQRSSLISNDPTLLRQLQSDPTNSFIWRMNGRRLDYEQMRDTVLAASGRLEETMYGRPLLITDADNCRRTVYAFVERQNIPDIVSTFDGANADTSTARRVTTTVPQQALFAMNSPFMWQSAEALAARVAGLTSPDQQVQRLYQFVYGRVADHEEVEVAEEFLRSGTAAQFAQALLMSNEAMFID